MDELRVLDYGGGHVCHERDKGDHAVRDVRAPAHVNAEHAHPALGVHQRGADQSFEAFAPHVSREGRDFGRDVVHHEWTAFGKHPSRKTALVEHPARIYDFPLQTLGRAQDEKLFGEAVDLHRQAVDPDERVQRERQPNENALDAGVCQDAVGPREGFEPTGKAVVVHFTTYLLSIPSTLSISLPGLNGFTT
jgi:hypothetical protein